ncbi:MAG TPA: dicarboxylate/amino acid:cation symporter [Gemmatimonadales bacterium]|nr:dicarboxylate/amino acid:cation symporter [Gemmatimonadales bacterium]
MPWYRKLHWQIVSGLVAGLLFGILAAAQGWGEFTANWIAPFGTIFLNALKLIAVPLVLTSLIAGVASLSDVKKLSRIGGRTITIYILTTTLAVTIGLVVVNTLRPGDSVPEAMRVELQETYAAQATTGTEAAEQAQARPPLQIMVDIVPENAIAAFGNNARMLQVVFVALVIGIALIQIPADKRQPVLVVVDGLQAVVIRIVEMIMVTAPVGVFALMAATITSVAGDSLTEILNLLGALGFYMIAVLLGLAIMGLVVYPLMLRMFSGMPIRHFFREMLPVQLLAFSTSSSGATLPVTMKVARTRLGVSREVSSFVLPLGATINMDGTALYQAVAAVFIAQTLGMEIGITGQLTIVLTAVLASIGTAAVPGAGIIMLVIILEAVNVPSGGIALILGVDRLLDMVRTMTNVTGDATVASIVASKEGQLQVPTADALASP